MNTQLQCMQILASENLMAFKASKSKSLPFTTLEETSLQERLRGASLLNLLINSKLYIKHRLQEALSYMLQQQGDKERKRKRINPCPHNVCVPYWRRYWSNFRQIVWRLNATYFKSFLLLGFCSLFQPNCENQLFWKKTNAFCHLASTDSSRL